MSVSEQEVSYTFTYSQDVLYRLADWLEANMTKSDEYVEMYDENDTRTRINGVGVSSSVRKRILDTSRISVLVGKRFVPMVKRECIEDVYSKRSEKIKRLSKTRVYTQNKFEMKFEQIYYEHNVGDTLDPLIANKQIALYNMLCPNTPIDITNNSHLGTDEILANCRFEMEYEGELMRQNLLTCAQFIVDIECVVLRDVFLAPFLSHTTLLNDTCYRPFVDERTEQMCCDDVKVWALKLNGVRGKGYIVNGHKMYVQLDDMRMYSGNLFNIGNNYLQNQILSIQIECMDRETFYITDILNVYKYKYDNRNQYDVSVGVTVEIFDAIQYIQNNSNEKWILKNENYTINVLFQKFYTHKTHVDTQMEDNDGFVGVLANGSLIKIKAHQSYEMKYTKDGFFVCSFGKFKASSGLYKRDKIYEVIIINDTNQIQVIKERPDRLISN
uniref:Late expression factor 4 n=1 Tax=Phthorimaea operculella granulovirus TaxID=192584 RepID=A0A481SC87_9BBAC|nr:late expression factor 4 [Phthorimaea operculella granulovirus]QBH67351.1 late expression factor 4 [Phthorimaea operculella granulovirus]